MINKKDFKLFKKENKKNHEDYWFKVSGETQNYLTELTFDMCMIQVTEVVYSKDENIIGIKRLFPFNYDVIIFASSDCLFQELYPVIRSFIEENS